MSPVTSEPMGYTDNNIVTGSINPQASLNAPVTNNMYTNTANNMSQTQYTVQAGDTIYSIGRKFNVHPNQIIERNPIPNPNSLLVGQTFSIPVTSTYAAGVNQNVYQPVQKSVPEFPQNTNTPNMSQSYTVQSGDTLYSIGRKFNIHPSYIINKNPAINPNYLSPGQVLNIVSKQDTPQNISTQKTVSNNQNNIMGTASAENNMDKQILSNALSLPVQGSIKENKNLRGVLISAADGDAVKASAAGEVIYVGNLNNYGNMILVRHDNGLVTNYARLKKTFVQKGQQVNKGDLIASAGISKEFNTSDVLFEVRKGTKAVNPLDYIG
jgi:murein DD-endopeptidase MepM/ murein hydrolase activator NlpD